MILTYGKIASDVDKDTYKCTIEVPGHGKFQSVLARCDNQPVEGDEVFVIAGDDPYANDVMAIPLNILGSHFTGVCREGFMMKFDDDGIHFTGKGGVRDGGGDSEVHIKADEIQAKMGSSQVDLKSTEFSITDGTGTMKGSSGSLTISGFSTQIQMAGMAGPPSMKGPFCALPACLFSGAPHVAEKVTGNT